MNILIVCQLETAGINLKWKFFFIILAGIIRIFCTTEQNIFDCIKRLKKDRFKKNKAMHVKREGTRKKY